MNDELRLPIAANSVQRPRYCCLAHLRSLIDNVRQQHRNPTSNRHALAAPEGQVELEDAAPNAHDDYCAELEASMYTADRRFHAIGSVYVDYNSPEELARARRLFAITLLIPMLLISAALVLLGPFLGRAMGSLLQFSVFALAIPLVASAGAGLVRKFRHQRAQ